MASQPIYQIYAELADYEPEMWRRFQVIQNISIARLGYIIMTLFEMQASHLFCIEVPYRSNYIQHKEKQGAPTTDELVTFIRPVLRYEVQNEWSAEFVDVQSMDACSNKLYKVLENEGDRASMQYDYGDGWEINLTVEKIFQDTELPGKELPRVLDGAGYGIIEDCGGTGGLEDIAEAFKKGSGEMYDTYSQWLGVEELDLATFDLEDMNFRLKKVPRIYSDAYELNLQPSDYSMRILTREYLK